MKHLPGALHSQDFLTQYCCADDDIEAMATEDHVAIGEIPTSDGQMSQPMVHLSPILRVDPLDFNAGEQTQLSVAAMSWLLSRLLCGTTGRDSV